MHHARGPNPKSTVVHKKLHFSTPTHINPRNAHHCWLADGGDVLQRGRSLRRILRLRSLGSPLAPAFQAPLATKRPAAARHRHRPGTIGLLDPHEVSRPKPSSRAAAHTKSRRGSGGEVLWRGVAEARRPGRPRALEHRATGAQDCAQGASRPQYLTAAAQPRQKKQRGPGTKRPRAAARESICACPR